MHLVLFKFVNVMTSVDGEEMKKMMLESLPESRKSGNG